MPNVLTTMHQSSSLVHKTSVNYQPILGSFFTDQNSAGCCSSNGEGYGNNKSHSTPWKLLNSVLKGSLVIEACRITTISMAKLMQQNTQFQQPKNMPGPGKEFVNFDLWENFAETWHLKLVEQKLWKVAMISCLNTSKDVFQNKMERISITYW